MAKIYLSFFVPVTRILEEIVLSLKAICVAG